MVSLITLCRNRQGAFARMMHVSIVEIRQPTDQILGLHGAQNYIDETHDLPLLSLRSLPHPSTRSGPKVS